MESEWEWEWKPKEKHLPPIPETLQIRGVRSLCFALMLRNLRDARDQEEYTRAARFAKSGWCATICETLDFDYPTYRAEVLRRCKKTAAEPKKEKPRRKRKKKPNNGC